MTGIGTQTSNIKVLKNIIKNLLVLIFLFMFLGCASIMSSDIPIVQLSDKKSRLDKMPRPQFLKKDVKYSMPQWLWRQTQYLGFFLKNEEKKQHKAAVFFMLHNSPDTKITSWYSNKRSAGGKVRVIKSYPISGGYCRTYQTYIKVNNKARHTTNNACKYVGSLSWSFYH